MAETITVKQLASRAGVESRVLRRILRQQFPRQAKGKSYEWQPDDPQIELILKAVKSNKAEKTKPKSEKPKVEEPKAKPKKPKISPRATLKLMSSTATSSPNLLTRFSTLTM